MEGTHRPAISLEGSCSTYNTGGKEKKGTEGSLSMEEELWEVLVSES